MILCFASAEVKCCVCDGIIYYYMNGQKSIQYIFYYGALLPTTLSFTFTFTIISTYSLPIRA